MRTSKQGIELIKSLEGFSSTIYICQGGMRTIGYGHVLSSAEKISVVTKEEAHKLFLSDLQKAERAVNKLISAKLNFHQFDALSSLTFNIGAAALQRSLLRQKINYDAGTDEIIFEIKRWHYSRGKALKALAIRRKIESKIFLYGYP